MKNDVQSWEIIKRHILLFLRPSYNPATRNHPNFRWRNNESHPQVSFPTNNPLLQIHLILNHHWEILFKLSYRRTNCKYELCCKYLQLCCVTAQLNKTWYDSMFNQLFEENKEIKSHISKLTNSLSVNGKGNFPSNTEANPKGVSSCEIGYEHAKSIISLRNGKKKI